MPPRSLARTIHRQVMISTTLGSQQRPWPRQSIRGLTGPGLSRPSAEADQPEAADNQRSQGEDAEDRDPDSARHPREACELVGVRALGSAPSTLAMQFHYRPDATEEQKPGHRVAEPGLNQCRGVYVDDRNVV